MIFLKLSTWLLLTTIINYGFAEIKLEKFVQLNENPPEAYFQEVDYVICGVDKYVWLNNVDRCLVSILDMDMCQKSVRDIIMNESDMKPLVYYIYPQNMTVFYDVLVELSIQLSSYSNGQDDPIIRKQPPIFILEWPSYHSSFYVFGSTKNRAYLNESLTPCFPLTSLVFLRDTSAGQYWELYSAYDDVMTIQEVAVGHNAWIQLSDLRNIVSRRQNLQNFNLKVLSKNDPENQGEATMTKINGVKTFKKGLAVEFLMDLQFGLNFTVEAIDGEDCMTQNPDGTLTGMGRQIVDGDAHLSLTISTFESYRLQWLSFLQPTTSANVFVFFHQPPTVLFRNIFIQPICYLTWLCLGLTWLLIMLSTWVVLQIDERETNICQPEIWIWVTGAFCQQGWNRTPNTTPMKIIFTVTFLTSMTIFIAYSASVVSHGLYSKSKPVREFSDLSRFEYILTGDFINRQLNVSNHESHERIPHEIFEIFTDYNHGRSKETVEDDDDEYEAIRQLFKNDESQKHYAHTDLLNRFYSEVKHLNFTEADFCELDSMEIATKLYQVGMFIRKRSPLQEFMNYRLIYTMERGLEKRHIAKFLEENIPCCGEGYAFEARPLPEKLALIDALMVFKILLGGIFASACLLALEYYANPHGEPYKKRTKVCG